MDMLHCDAWSSLVLQLIHTIPIALRIESIDFNALYDALRGSEDHWLVGWLVGLPHHTP